MRPAIAVSPLMAQRIARCSGALVGRNGHDEGTAAAISGSRPMARPHAPDLRQRYFMDHHAPVIRMIIGGRGIPRAHSWIRYLGDSRKGREGEQRRDDAFPRKARPPPDWSG
jgi:hypothetical protein